MSSNRPRTSAYLLACLQDPKGENLPPLVSHFAGAPPFVWNLIGGGALYQYERLHDEFGGLRGSRTDLAHVLDDSLCRLLIQAIPDMVERLQKFDQLMVEKMPNERVQSYFGEAMRCYVVGLPAAAVALARACLEQALRDMIPLPHTTGLELDALITASGHSKVLDPAHLQMAREVQRSGNQVLHKQGCSDNQALEAIINLRAVVEALCGPAIEE